MSYINDLICSVSVKSNIVNCYIERCRKRAGSVELWSFRDRRPNIYGVPVGVHEEYRPSQKRDQYVVRKCDRQQQIKKKFQG